MSSEDGFEARSDGQLFAAAAAAVARSDDLDEALAELVGLTVERLGASRGAAYIFDQAHDELELAVTLGIDDAAVADASSVGPVGRSQDPLSAALRGRRPVSLEEGADVPALGGGTASGAAYLLPLVVRRDGIELALGVLALGFSGGLPAAADLAIGEPIADLAAVAVERAVALSLGSERAEWFERLAHTDPLTGLANRRTLDRMLELELARAARQGVALGVALFEVDGFESILQEGGKAAGDEALRAIAQVLSDSVRLVDTVARYGGEQFALVAPGPDALVVAGRLVQTISALPAAGTTPLSVSAGIAAFPGDGRTPGELLSAAEGAAARARAAGGGRVEIPDSTGGAGERADPAPGRSS